MAFNKRFFIFGFGFCWTKSINDQHSVSLGTVFTSNTFPRKLRLPSPKNLLQKFDKSFQTSITLQKVEVKMFSEINRTLIELLVSRQMSNNIVTQLISRFIDVNFREEKDCVQSRSDTFGVEMGLQIFI